MKIVITGGAGFIGRNLAHYLRRASNATVLYCVDHASPETGVFDVVQQSCFADQRGAEVYTNADAIIHLAATTTVQDSIQNPVACFDNNVTKTLQLLEILRDVAPKAHFVFASTGGAIIGNHDGPIDETLCPRPLSPYGASKLAVEGLLTAFSGSYGITTTALRFANVYGPHSERKTSVVAQFCKACVADKALQVNGPGTQTRDYVYVDDICDAIWRVIERRASGTFQLGTGVATSILDLINALKDLNAGKEFDVVHRPNLPGEVRHNLCNIAHATDRIGYRPRHSLQSGLHETLNWFQAKVA